MTRGSNKIGTKLCLLCIIPGMFGVGRTSLVAKDSGVYKDLNQGNCHNVHGHEFEPESSSFEVGVGCFWI